MASADTIQTRNTLVPADHAIFSRSENTTLTLRTTFATQKRSHRVERHFLSDPQATMADCETCYRTFNSWSAANQHMNALNHWKVHECETCNYSSIHEDEVDSHMNRYNHWAPTFDCEACNTKFHTQQQARTHMDNNNHWRLNWCNLCKRGFQNANNLRMVCMSG